MAESIFNQLKSLGKEWKSTKAREATGFVKLPDGDYEGVCKQARLENSKNSGRLQVAWMHVILSGAEKGKKTYTYQGIGDTDNISWLKYTIKAHGVKPPKSIENLPKFLEACIDKKVNLTIQTNGTFTNTYINEFGKTKEESDEEEDLDLEDL